MTHLLLALFAMGGSAAVVANATNHSMVAGLALLVASIWLAGRAYDADLEACQ